MNEAVNFVSDIFFDGLLYAVTVRSPVARGVLLGIETPSLPESCFLITAEHIPGKNELADFPVPILAEKNLSYIGQPVAILAGPEEPLLEELLSQIKVIAEETEKLASDEQAHVRRDIVSGNPQRAFEKSEKIIEGTYDTGVQAHWYPEPQGAVVSFSINERTPSLPALTIHSATQWPYHVKRSVEQVLGWDSGSVTVNPQPAAGHLDGKIWYPSLIACHAALAACISGSPVKLMLSGEEDFLYAPKRNGAHIQIRSALGEKNEILASALEVKVDLGADGVFKDEIIDHSCLGALGLYQRKAFIVSGAGLCSNIPAQGPLSGFGLAQGFFAAERHACRIAEAAGENPAQWRKNNFLKEKQNLAIGTSRKNAMPLTELIDNAAAASGYYRKWASYELLRNSRRGKNFDFLPEPLRGIGIAAAFAANGFLYNDESNNGNCTVEMRLEKDGSLEIKTSAVFSGNGEPLPQIWRNLAQEILGVEGGLVRLANSTGHAPDSGVAALSRTISVVTKLVEKCCMAIRSQRFRKPLPITVKRSSLSSKKPGWGAAPKNIESDAFSRLSWGAAAVEIEINPVSLAPVIRGIWFAVDCGKILSLQRAHSALKTGIIHALGWTCRERVFYKDGKIPRELYRAYDITAAQDVPPIHIEFIRSESADPRGIGDLPFCCVPAAYTQAVSQAMDFHFEKIPLCPLEIGEAAKQKRQQQEVPE